MYNYGCGAWSYIRARDRNNYKYVIIMLVSRCLPFILRYMVERLISIDKNFYGKENIYGIYV